MYYLLLFILILLFSFQSLGCKLFSDAHSRRGLTHTTGVYTAVNGIGISVITYVLNRFAFHFSITTFLLALSTALILFLYNTSLINATKLGPYSIVVLFMLSGSIILPLLFNVLFMGEKLSGYQMIGFVLILFAIGLTNLEKKQKKAKDGRFYLWCASLFASNGLYGVFMNLQQTLQKGTERNEMIILSFGLCAVVTFIIYYFKDRDQYLRAYKAPFGVYKWILLTILVSTAAINLFLYAISIAPSTSVLFAVNNGGVLIASMLFSLVLFKEKIKPLQWIGLALCCVGMIFIA